jgi:hypothetical protein
MSSPSQRPESSQGENGAVASHHDQEAVLSEVRKALGSIEYGSVLIKIHQGEVVGIETSTKVRLKNN